MTPARKPMIFALEALQAFHGDSLLVHAGSADEPVLLLVDGGPSGTWETSLRPRLEELRAERAGDGALQIDLAMVSHIDSDHVAGMVDFGGELVTEQQDSQPLRYEVGTLWHNSFDDVLGNDADDLRAAAVEILAVPVADRVADEIRAAGLAVVASVAEGRELRDQAETLGWSVNEPFDGPVVLPREGVRTITLGPLKLTVVCPTPSSSKSSTRPGRSGSRIIRRPSPTPPPPRPAATPRPTTSRASSCSPSAGASGCC